MTAEPTNVCSSVALVAARSPVFELKVRLVPVLAGKLPVVPVANNTLQVVSDDSSASVMFVAFVEVPVTSPVTLPVKFPENVVAVITPTTLIPDSLDVTADPTVVCSNVALVAARSPVFELKVRLVPVLAGKLPVVPVANKMLQV